MNFFGCHSSSLWHQNDLWTHSQLSNQRQSTLLPEFKTDSISRFRPSTSTGKRVKFAGGDVTESDVVDRGEDEFELELDSKKSKDVVVDGYDSDSSAGSDSGFGVGGGRKGNTTTELEKVDDDDDMFGDEPPAGTTAKNDTKGKAKEFLDLGDIEGQEFGKGDDEGQEVIEDEEEEYLQEDDMANDDDAPRTSRNKATMGYKLRFVFFFIQFFTAHDLLQFF